MMPAPDIEALLVQEHERILASDSRAKVTPIQPKRITAEDLLDDDTVMVPELAIDGFLPRVGLMLLGGRPKDGKTWLACQMALSIVTGTALCGWLRVKQPGRVHLWALEDQYAITKDKLLKLLRGARPDGLRDLHIFEQLAKPILQGGDAVIRGALQQRPAEVVILDSLFKICGHQQPSQDISQRDYSVIDRVRKIALDFRCAVIIIMHTRKGARGGDPIENLLGTSGNTAAADVVAELKRTGHNGKLTVTGRMVQREDYELVWHQGDSWGWTIEGAGDDASVGETAEEVIGFLEAQGASKPATIAAGIKKSFGSVWMALKRLQDRGKVVRGKDKRWEVVR